MLADGDEVGPLQERFGNGRPACHLTPRDERSKQALPAERDERPVRRDDCPRIAELAGHRPEDNGREIRRLTPVRRQGRRRHRVRDGEAVLAATRGRLDVLEDRAVDETDRLDVRAGGSQEVELGRRRRDRVDAHEHPSRDSEPGKGETGIRHRATEPPPSRVVRGQVA